MEGTMNCLYHKRTLVSACAVQIVLGKSNDCPAGGELDIRMLRFKLQGI